LEFKNIILEEKLSNKFKNGHENFSGVRVAIVLGLLAWILDVLKPFQRFTGKSFVGEILHDRF
jgi:hypothetical protein